MTRKHVLVAAILVLLLLFYGCGRPVSKQNTIAPKALTEDQQEIVDLLSSNDKQELLFFSYQVDAEYSTMDVWAEVYKDGELVEPHAGGISMMEPQDRFQGDLAIVITQNPDFQWTFVVKQGGSKATSTGQSDLPIDAMGGRAYGPILEPVYIEDGREIILYTSLFSSDGSLNAYDAQTLEEEPDLLKEYDYAQIIKCRFSK